jgi:hypothetical protein
MCVGSLDHLDNCKSVGVFNIKNMFKLKKGNIMNGSKNFAFQGNNSDDWEQYVDQVVFYI